MIETPLYMQAGTYSARQDRLVFDVLFTEGIIDPGAGSFAVTERAAGPNMSVDVAPGRAVVDGDDQANQGAYFVRSAGVENVVIAPADLVNPRIDLVVLRIRDSNVIGGANNDAIVDVIEGVPAAVPAAPALPASAIPLARIAVPVGMVDVEDADVTDVRVPSSTREFTVTSGWQRVTTAERDALVPDPGQAVYNVDADDVETWNGVDWISSAGYFLPLTTAQRDALAAPDLYTGRVILNTDTDEVQFYDGAGWVSIPEAGLALRVGKTTSAVNGVLSTASLLGQGDVTSTTLIGAVALRATPMEVTRAATIERASINVSTAAAATKRVRLGLYKHDPATGAPGALHADFGTVLVDTTGTKQITGLAVAITPGIYWFAVLSEAQTEVLRGRYPARPLLGLNNQIDTSPAAGIGQVLNDTQAWGALPANFPALDDAQPANNYLYLIEGNLGLAP